MRDTRALTAYGAFAVVGQPSVLAPPGELPPRVEPAEGSARRPHLPLTRAFAATGAGKTAPMARTLLGIYLNDHLAGATVAVELARRTARANDGTPLGAFLRDSLLPEIDDDRATLERLMKTLDIKTSRPKVLAGWTAEKVGRLKLNGELRRYSPLSRLLELDGLAAGIELKRALWLALAAGPPVAGFDFDQLTQRADAQRVRLEEHRRTAASLVTGSVTPHEEDAGSR